MLKVKKIKVFRLFSLLFFLQISYHACSQTNENFYNFFDKYHQIRNQKIFNGIEYREIYRTINEKHSFLKGKEFYNASLYYDGEIYLDIPIRYDMFQDLIVIKVQIENGQVFIIQLNNLLLERFNVSQQTFVYNYFKDDNLEKGFYEVLLESDCATLWKKRKFKPSEKRDRSYLYYEFEELETQRILKFSNRNINLSRRELIENFPKHKEEVNSFFKKNRSLKKLNEDKFYKDLILMLSQLNCR